MRAQEPTTPVRIHMVNSATIAIATVATPGGIVTYEGDARIDGVPGTAAPVLLDFAGYRRFKLWSAASYGKCPRRD